MLKDSPTLSHPTSEIREELGMKQIGKSNHFQEEENCNNITLHKQQVTTIVCNLKSVTTDHQNRETERLAKREKKNRTKPDNIMPTPSSGPFSLGLSS